MKHKLFLFFLFTICAGNIFADNKPKTITIEYRDSLIGTKNNTLTVPITLKTYNDSLGSNLSSLPAFWDNSFCNSKRFPEGENQNKDSVNFTFIDIFLYNETLCIPVCEGEGKQCSTKGKELFRFILKREHKQPRNTPAESTDIKQISTPVDGVQQSAYGENTESCLDKAIRMWEKEPVACIVLLCVVGLSLLMIFIFVYLGVSTNKLAKLHKKSVKAVDETLDKITDKLDKTMTVPQPVVKPADNNKEYFDAIKKQIDTILTSVKGICEKLSTLPSAVIDNSNKATVTASAEAVSAPAKEVLMYGNYNSSINGFKFIDGNEKDCGFVLYFCENQNRYEFGINANLSDSLWSQLGLIKNAVELTGNEFERNGKTFRTEQRGRLEKTKEGYYIIKEKAKVSIIDK